MSADLYQRPSRDAIAARVRGELPGGQPPPGRKPERKPEDYVACFGMHLRARMRVLGWTQGEVAKRAGMSGAAASRAINGHSVPLGPAAKIAAIVGSDLLAMLQPYACGTCRGTPPPGYACLECGTETRPLSPGDRLAEATAERTGRAS